MRTPPAVPELNTEILLLSSFLFFFHFANFLKKLSLYLRLSAQEASSSEIEFLYWRFFFKLTLKIKPAPILHKDGNKIHNAIEVYQIIHIGFIIKDACLQNP